MLEVVAEGRTGAGAEGGSHACPLPARSKSHTWRYGETSAPCTLELLPLPVSQLRSQNPAAVTDSPEGRAGGAAGEGVIARRRTRSCVQHVPAFHRGLKLSFLGQLLGPSCNITGLFLAIQSPERLCEVPAVARGGQPVRSSDCSREKDSKSLTASATAALFQWGNHGGMVYSPSQGPPVSTSYLGWKQHTNTCVSPCPKVCFVK